MTVASRATEQHAISGERLRQAFERIYGGHAISRFAVSGAASTAIASSRRLG